MEKERLKFCIDRFDLYYDSVNTKSNVLLAFEVFITGGLVSLYPFLLGKVNCTICVHLILGALIALGLSAILITKIATTPYLSPGSGSLFYFGSIANMSEHQFVTRSEQMTDPEELTDLRKQTSALAKGLAGKFHKLRIASIMITIQFALFIPLIILILINLK